MRDFSWLKGGEGLNQWRTVVSLLILGVFFLFALGICRSALNGPALLATTEECFKWLGLGIAGKAAIQHAAIAIAAATAKEPAASKLADGAAKVG